MISKHWRLALCVIMIFLFIACGEAKSFSSSGSYSSQSVEQINDEKDTESSKDSDDQEEAAEVEELKIEDIDPVDSMRTADAAVAADEKFQQENAKNQNIQISFNELEDIREVYRPLNDCAPSRLMVGDTVYVSYGGSPNAIRSEPDVHPSDNKVYIAVQGEQLKVVGGPACSWGWILWKVKTSNGVVGWTPESDGKEFWLVPIIEPREIPTKIKSNSDLYKAYKEVEDVMSDKSLSNSEKQKQLRIKQDKYGEEVVSYIIRYVPVYNSDKGGFESFDSMMRGFASDYGDSSTSAPIEKDPVGAGMKIFFDPSPDTITDMLGLSGLGGGEAPSPYKTGAEPTQKAVVVPTNQPTRKPTIVPTSPPAQMRIIYQNECNQDIFAAIHYTDLSDNWITKGWWRIPPGGTADVADTRNIYFLYYAVTEDRSSEWKGDYSYLSVRGSSEKYPFGLIDTGKIYSTYTVPFKCP